MTKPYLFISPKEYPGTTAGMKHFLATKIVDYSDEISKKTVEERYAVILGAWHPIYYEAIKRLKTVNVEIWLFWTSTVGQIDFSNNGIEISYLYLISKLVKSGLIDKLLCGNEQVQSMLENIVGEDKVILLPYCFDIEKIRQYYNPEIFEGDRWVDLYCPSGVRKNITTQIHGAKLANAHLFFSRILPKYSDFAELLGVKYTIMGWMERDIFYRSIQTMALGSQVTFAESFDYAVAEHFALGRPCLYSPVIGQWINDPYLEKMLLVKDSDNPKLIGEKMKNILDLDESDKKDLNKRCEEFIIDEAERRNENGRKILEEHVL